MARFVAPTTTAHASFLSAMAEFAAEGRRGDGSMVGDDLADWAPGWSEPAVFAAYVDSLRAAATEEGARAAGWVPCTTLWWMEGPEADPQHVGRLAIRHRLTDRLREVGGHLGYDVRASRRREGHATAMLRAALPYARILGIERALVTCDDDNVGSIRTIEAAGGVLEDARPGARAGKRRYWVGT